MLGLVQGHPRGTWGHLLTLIHTCSVSLPSHPHSHLLTPLKSACSCSHPLTPAHTRSPLFITCSPSLPSHPHTHLLTLTSGRSFWEKHS